MAHLLILNGPNLNLLGTREPEVYGHETLKDIENSISQLAKSLGHEVDFLQSNAEHELIYRIHQAKSQSQFIIINPAAYTHTSVAIRDALAGVAIPFIEVHLSNVYQREAFRKHSYFSDIAEGVICGMGSQGYLFAVQRADQLLK